MLGPWHSCNGAFSACVIHIYAHIIHGSRIHIHASAMRTFFSDRTVERDSCIIHIRTCINSVYAHIQTHTPAMQTFSSSSSEIKSRYSIQSGSQRAFLFTLHSLTQTHKQTNKHTHTHTCNADVFILFFAIHTHTQHIHHTHTQSTASLQNQMGLHLQNDLTLCQSCRDI